MPFRRPYTSALHINMLVTPFAVHQNKAGKAIRGEINTEFLITEFKTWSITLLAPSHSGIYGSLILLTLCNLHWIKQVTKTSIWVGSKINSHFSEVKSIQNSHLTLHIQHAFFLTDASRCAHEHNILTL